MATTVERGLLLNGLLAAMRLSPEPMVVSDPHQDDNPIIAANQPFQDLTQYDEAELTGRNCRFLQGRGTDQRSVKMLGDGLRRGEGFVQFLVNYRRDGTPFFNLLFVSPVFGSDGTLHFFFASQHDLIGQSTLDVAEFPIGQANMLPGRQKEFRLLLIDIAHEVSLAGGDGPLEERVRALDAAVTGAREVALLATKLEPGAPARS